jgi:hypothetical protein
LTISAQQMRAVFYPGPFSLLVLKDGSILRRGAVTSIPASLVADLQSRDGLIPVPSEHTWEAGRAAHYPRIYKTLGSGCLLDVVVEARRDAAGSGELDALKSDTAAAVSDPDWEALRDTTHDIRQRLLRLLECAEPYFVLSGSDPRDSGGCCPSAEVGAANRLVDGGVLACYRTPGPPDACSTTIYAFAGEICITDGRPHFTINTRVREQAAAALRTAGRGVKPGLRKALTAVMLTLVAVSLVLAGRRAALSVRASGPDFETAMARSLGVTGEDNRLFVCFFRGREHCEACDSMGRLCRKTIETHFAQSDREGSLIFREVTYDTPANRAIKTRLGLGVSTVGLVRYVRGRPGEIKMLTREAWNLWTDENAFVGMLRDEIQTARGGGE